ncbi:tripartite tricarboxylate transporter permease [Halomonas sp. A29]|uniref:tripartite tricarboxylate transporter permease n=1 Tax=Halomonas sp. A29 TaxID=3102786 RepID=UPI00398B89C5
MLELLLQGFASLLDPLLLLMLVASVAIGIMVGALPGISPSLGVAIASPLTFVLDPFTGISCLIGIYVGAIYGGAIPATVIGIPGSATAVTTVLDGYAMGRKGKAGLALGLSTISSCVGGILASIVLILLAYPISQFALSLGPREYCAIAVLALTAVASLSGDSFLKGSLACLIGLFLATIGLDAIHGQPRFTMGSPYLMGGVPFIAVIIGLFAIPEIMQRFEKISQRSQPTMQVSKVLPDWPLMRRLIPTQVRSSAIGVVVGAVPGAGGDVASIISYSQGRNLSKNRDRYGTGEPEGIVCSEAANSASAVGALIPLLTLGLPGGAVTAVIIGSFMIHGLQPGPLLMQDHAPLVYQFFATTVLVNVMLLLVGLPGAKLFSRALQVKEYILLPIILLICIIGAYALRNNAFDILVMLGIGVFGYCMAKAGIPRPPVIIGMILGPMIENEVARGLLVTRGNPWDFITPVSAVIWAIALLPFYLPLIKLLFRKMKRSPLGAH